MAWSAALRGVGVGAVLVGVSSAGAGAPDTGAPDVLLVILDDVGFDKLAVYGEPQLPPEPWPDTPTLDGLAAAGVTFTNAHANPTCSATRMQLLTGRHGFRTGVQTFIGFDGGNTNYVVPDSERFLPELLRDGFAPGTAPGYTSGLFGKWHLAPEVSASVCDPIENGFARFVGQIGNHKDHFAWPLVSARAAPGNAGCLALDPGGPESRWNASFVRRAAEEWIAQTAGPFLCVVAFNPPHGPMQVPPLVGDAGPMVAAGTLAELRAAGLDHPGSKVPSPFPCSQPPRQLTYQARLVYRAMLEAVDHELGRLLAACPPDTAVFVVGDNGTPDPVLPIDLSAPAASGPPYPAQHSKRSIGYLGTRVPLIVSGPLVTAPGRTSDELVGATDLFATIAELVGADPTGGPPTDSVSFLSLLTSTTAVSQRAFAFSEYALVNGWSFDPTLGKWVHGGTGQQSVRPPTPYYRALTNGRYRYIRTTMRTPLSACPPGGPTVCPEQDYAEELYDVSVDPNELTNLICAPPPGADVALAALRAEMDTLPCPCD